LDRTTLTYRFERLRAIGSGILETAFTTFLLLIAVQWFEFGATAKATIAAAGALGFMLGPVVVSRVAELGWITGQAASRLALGAAGCFGLLAVVENQWLFIGGIIVATTMGTAAIPLVTQIYQENYPARSRGKYFSRTAMIRIVSAAAFGLLAGWILTNGEDGKKLSDYPHWLMGVFAGAFAWASFCFSRLPAKPLTGSKGTHPFRSLRFVKEDKLFRHILICWMLFGIGNLMLFPLRVEYLANAKIYEARGDYVLGIDPTPANIALILVFIPNAVKLVCSPFWGKLFDRMNFFVLRVVLNGFFAASLLVFFHSESWPGFIVAAVLFGIGNSGGEVAWSLWVTKFAPAKHVADYMSVHVFFNGIRVLLAPFLGFWLIVYVPASSLSLFGAGIIIASSLALLSDYPSGEKARRGAALTEEISD
jgi:MFS family permease